MNDLYRAIKKVLVDRNLTGQAASAEVTGSLRVITALKQGRLPPEARLRALWDHFGPLPRIARP